MTKLRTRDITIENNKEVFRHWNESNLHPTITKLGYWALGHVYKPTVTFAEGAKELIEQYKEEALPVMILANHVRYVDHLVLAGAIYHDAALNHFAGNTFALGKAAYFQSRLNRWTSELMDTGPVWRPDDFPADASRELRQEVGEGTEEMIMNRIRRNQNLAAFPESTRNKDRENWHTVMKIKSGMGRIAYKAWKHEKIKMPITPFGLAYPKASSTDWRRANVHVGVPIEPFKGSIGDINNRIQVALQDSVIESNSALYPYEEEIVREAA